MSDLSNEQIDKLIGDPYETCCPHCGFCGEYPAHEKDCVDCKEPAHFVHDDDEFCRFLGHFDGHDLYIHTEFQQTYVARYSDEGPDYKSGVHLVGRDEHITMAHKIADALGIALTNVPEGSEF